MQATIGWTFLYAGEKHEAAKLLEPFDRLESISTQEGTVPYPEVSQVLGGGLDSELCASNRTHIVATASLQVYNVTAQRQIYDLFSKKIAEAPELADTRVLHEGYSVQAVRNVNLGSSAYALRDDHLLMYKLHSSLMNSLYRCLPAGLQVLRRDPRRGSSSSEGRQGMGA